MRDKAIIIAELKAAIAEWSNKADEMADCGGIQGAAVLEQNPKLAKKLQKLGEEAEKAGITKEDLK